VGGASRFFCLGLAMATIASQLTIRAFEKKLAKAQEIMARYRNTLHLLAK